MFPGFVYEPGSAGSFGSGFFCSSVFFSGFAVSVLALMPDEGAPGSFFKGDAILSCALSGMFFLEGVESTLTATQRQQPRKMIEQRRLTLPLSSFAFGERRREEERLLRADAPEEEDFLPDVFDFEDDDDFL